MREDAVRVTEDDEAQAPRELRAGRFTLVDRHGNARATLGVADDGAPGIQLNDVAEQPRVLLALEASGAATLKLLDSDGDVRVWLAVSRNGSPSLYLRGTSRYADASTGHAELAVDEHGCPNLSLCDTDGQPRLLLGLDEQGSIPRLSLSSAGGELRALLIADRERGTLNLYPEPAAAEAAPAVPFRLRAESTNAHTNGHGPVASEAHVTVIDPPLAQPRPAPAAPAPEPPAAPAPAVAEAPVPTPRPRSRYLRLAVPLAVLCAAALGASAYSFFTDRTTPEASSTATTVTSGTIEGEEFVLRGQDGNVHGRLALLPDGSPFLQLTGRGGQGTATLSILPKEGPVLKLADGKSLVSVRAKSDGSSEIMLHTVGREPRAALFLQEDGTPVLSMTDAEGRVRAGLTISSDGSPSLSLYDETTLRAMLGTAGGTSTLTLLDEHGRVRFNAPQR